MKQKRLEFLVQKKIDKDVDKNSKHFSHETINRQIKALIEILAPMVEEVKKDG